MRSSNKSSRNFVSPICLILFSAFALQRGRVALRLQTEDVRCRKVYFKTGSFESSRGNVRVQTTINYFNYSGNFIHDAAVTWVENVNLSSFDVCALKAGRLDRLTPDGGLTFVDFIAFQEAPKSSSAGQVIMTNWWDGTQCESVTFEVSLNCNKSPYIKTNPIGTPSMSVSSDHKLSCTTIILSTLQSISHFRKAKNIN